MKVKEIGNINENIYKLPVDKVYEALSSSSQGLTPKNGQSRSIGGTTS